ncbi:MAG: hypothetical protein A2Y28_03670 [Chlamydiae bacterium GWC2_50_10]|nr:MAG: hypothetical protein A2Y28_03670 [Chlamydiae bacterium GWC2_50_10]
MYTNELKINCNLGAASSKCGCQKTYKVEIYRTHFKNWIWADAKAPPGSMIASYPILEIWGEMRSSNREALAQAKFQFFKCVRYNWI